MIQLGHTVYTDLVKDEEALSRTIVHIVRYFNVEHRGRVDLVVKPVSDSRQSKRPIFKAEACMFRKGV